MKTYDLVMLLLGLHFYLQHPEILNPPAFLVPLAA